MNIAEHLKRIEEKLDYIIEATGLEEINQQMDDNPAQLHFPWYQNYTPSQESDVLK